MGLIMIGSLSNLAPFSFWDDFAFSMSSQFALLEDHWIDNCLCYIFTANISLHEASQGAVIPSPSSSERSDMSKIWSFLSHLSWNWAMKPGVTSHPTRRLISTHFSGYCGFLLWSGHTVLLYSLVLGLLCRANIRIQNNPAAHSGVWVWCELIFPL